MIRVWDVEAGSGAVGEALQRLVGRILGIVFLFEVVSGQSRDGMIRVWDVEASGSGAVGEAVQGQVGGMSGIESAWLMPDQSTIRKGYVDQHILSGRLKLVHHTEQVPNSAFVPSILSSMEGSCTTTVGQLGHDMLYDYGTGLLLALA